jgi:hypothetical protein
MLLHTLRLVNSGTCKRWYSGKTLCAILVVYFGKCLIDEKSAE